MSLNSYHNLWKGEHFQRKSSFNQNFELHQTNINCLYRQKESSKPASFVLKFCVNILFQSSFCVGDVYMCVMMCMFMSLYNLASWKIFRTLSFQKGYKIRRNKNDFMNILHCYDISINNTALTSKYYTNNCFQTEYKFNNFVNIFRIRIDGISNSHMSNFPFVCQYR